MAAAQTGTEATSRLAERVYQALRSAIITCQLRPGEPLQEARLVRELGVSKTPVREGLVRLAETGLVTSIPFRGYAVSEVTPKDVREISQLRAVLEGLAAREAAVRLTEQQLDELEQLASLSSRQVVDGDASDAAELGHAIHVAVYANCGNSRLRASIERLDDEFDRMRALAGRPSDRRPEDEHAAVVAALRTRDPDRAENVLRAHVVHVFDHLLRDLVSQAHSSATSTEDWKSDF
jgi:DNA-binding GntR family transcriptional regulator